MSTESVIATTPDETSRDAPAVDVTRLRVALARLARRLRKHELAGLTPTQLAALATVERSGPMRLGDLAAAEGIAPSTLTRLVTALEESGYATPLYGVCSLFLLLTRRIYRHLSSQRLNLHPL